MKFDTLNEEQHYAIQELARIRHEIHSSIDSMFDTESQDAEYFDYIDYKINDMLSEYGLPSIKFPDVSEIPTADWYYDLDSNERDEWEEKAEEYNRENPSGLKHNGFTLWREESWEYKDFYDTLEKINTTIEDYLREIDKKHGTDYAPTGFSRLQYSLPQEVEEEYMSAVESGDTEAQSRLVYEAARSAGYTERVMHGTKRFGFTLILHRYDYRFYTFGLK